MNVLLNPSCSTSYKSVVILGSSQCGYLKELKLNQNNTTSFPFWHLYYVFYSCGISRVSKSGDFFCFYISWLPGLTIHLENQEASWIINPCFLEIEVCEILQSWEFHRQRVFCVITSVPLSEVISVSVTFCFNHIQYLFELDLWLKPDWSGYNQYFYTNNVSNDNVTI